MAYTLPDVNDNSPRVEKLLQHLAGKAVNLPDITDRSPRIERILQYIIDNGGIGGGGGAGGGITEAQVKGLIAELYKDSNFDSNTGIITFTSYDGQTETLDLSSLMDDYAHKTLDNDMMGKNTFKELYVYDDDSYKSVSYAYGNQTGYGGRWTGLRCLNTGLLQDGYVSKIRIYVDTTVPFTALDIFPVTLGADINADTILDKLSLEASYPIISNGTLKYIDVDINQTFTNNTYFIIGAVASGNTRRFMSAGTNVIASNAADKVNMTSSPQAGGTITNAADAWVLKYELFGRESIQKALSEWDYFVDHITEYPYANLADYSKVVAGQQYEDNGITSTHATYGTLDILNIKADAQYTILKQNNDNHKILFFGQDGGVLGTDTSNAPARNGWHRKVVNTPAGTVKIGLMVSPANSSAHTIMVIEGSHLEETISHIPFVDGDLIQIGTNVSFKFDNSNTNIKSTTYESAIKELNDRIANAGGGTVTSVNNVQPVSGNVTLTLDNGLQVVRDKFAEYVPVADVDNAANKIPRIGQDGKLVATIIPDLAITSITNVTSQQEAVDKITSNSIQVGDVVVMTTANNEVYMYNGNTTTPTFDNSFIKLSLADGTVKLVNGQGPTGTGEVTVKAEHIDYDNAASGLASDKVQSAIDELNDNLKTTYADAEYDVASQTLTLTKVEPTEQTPLDLTDLVSKTNDNIVESKSGFKNGYIKGDGTVATLENPNALQEAAGAIPWFCSEVLKVPANTFVTSIIVGVVPTQANQTISGIKVSTIDTNINISNSRVLSNVIVNGSAKVEAYIDGDIGAITHAVKIPINKKWETDVLLAIEMKHMMLGESTNSKLHANGTQGIPNVGEELTGFNDSNNRPTNVHGCVKILSEDIPFTDLINEEVFPIQISDVVNLQTELTNRVLTSDTTVTGGKPEHNGKIVKLNDQGMIDNSMLEGVYVNNYYSVREFTEDAWNELQEVLLNGDLLHAQDTNKRYYCYHEQAGTWEDKFICFDELGGTGNGTVTKVNNVGPDGQGNVSLTLNNGLTEVKTALDLKADKTYVDTTFIPKTDAVDSSTGNAQAGKVVKLDNNGLVSVSMIPKIAITDVKKYDTKDLALQAATSGDIQNGDVVIIANEKNSIHMLADSAAGTTFSDKFIELSLGDGTIKTIGSQAANATGNIELSFVYGTDEYELRANGVKIASLPTMTEAEKQEIIDLFV